MLTQLKVTNFAIADHIEILFEAGMTVLSGETGAGKSIILDALGLALGDRADTSMVRHGEEKAEISAVFELENQHEAAKWLSGHDMEEGSQCILRRIITSEGRSRSYINGRPCPLQNLKAIGELLIDIHSQHEHQSLLKKDKHRDILDEFGQLDELSTEVSHRYRAWSEKAQQLAQIESSQDELEARLQLLKFQVDEFDKLALLEDEVIRLEHEQSELSHAELLLNKAHEAFGFCYEGDVNAAGMISSATHALQNLPAENNKLSEALTLLNDAQILIDEASNSLREFVESFELDPEKLQRTEDRLSAIYQLARKHRCNPEELPETHFKLSREMKQYLDGDHNIEQLQHDVNALKSSYLAAAEKQRTLRAEQAYRLEVNVADQLAILEMKTLQFKVNIQPLDNNKLSQNGLDTIEFLISTNPGQPAKSLNKIASGGELSRISLAIQVVIARNSTIPTLVFDEVDVGIGGGTAQTVGRLLKSLGNCGQVICVTHLPQVASQGEHHFFISKKLEDGKIRSYINLLDEAARTREIARMLGGITITEQTLAHAKEMLNCF